MCKKWKWKRVVSWMLVTAMLAGNITQLGVNTAFAAEQMSIVSSAEGENELLIQINQEDIEAVLNMSKEDRPEFDPDLIPFEGGKQEKTSEFIEKELTGKILIDQGGDGERMYLIVIEPGESEDLISRVKLIGINANEEEECVFRLLLNGETLNFNQADISRYEVVQGDKEEIEERNTQVSSPSDAKPPVSTSSSADKGPGSVPEGNPASDSNATPPGPGSDVPETSAPAPDTGVPETSAPVETAPVPETGASESPETSAPETSAAETVAPEESATAPETGAPEETVAAPETGAPEASTTAPEIPESEEAVTVEKTTAPKAEARETQSKLSASEPEEKTDSEEIADDSDLETDSPQADGKIEEDEEIKSDSGNSGDVSVKTEKPKKETAARDDEEDDEAEVPEEALEDMDLEDDIHAAGIFELGEKEKLGAEDLMLLNNQSDAAVSDNMVLSLSDMATEAPELFALPVGASGITVLDAKTGVREKVKEYAEELLGENGSYIIGEISIEKSSPAGEEIRSGDNITYYISYDVSSRPRFEYENNRLSELYDLYKDTTIRLTLPEDFEIVECQKEYKMAGDGTNTMEIALGDLLGGIGGNIKLDVKVMGNGLTPIGTRYEIKPQDLSLSASLDVKDKSLDDDGVIIATYNKTVNFKNTLPVVTSSDDKWGVRKSLLQNNDGKDFYYNEKDDTLTVNYKVEVGLVSGDDGNNINTDPARYRNTGRAPMTSFELSEDISLVNAGAVSDVVIPKSFSISKYNGESVIGDPVAEISNSGKLTLSMEDLNTCGDGGLSEESVDQGAPYYTQYKVTAVYPANEFRVDFNDPRAADAELFKIHNEAGVQYKLTTVGSAPVMEGSAADEADVTAKFVNAPGQITIEKKIGNKLSGIGESYTTALADKYPGAAEFEITTKDGKPVTGMKRQVNGNFEDVDRIVVNPKTDAGEDGLYVTGDDGSVNIFLTDGDYVVKEIGAPAGTILADNSFEFSVKNGICSSEEPIVFINEIQEGGIQFKKEALKYDMPNGGNAVSSPLQGAKFELLDENGNSFAPAIEAESDKDGKVTFYPLPAGLYQIKEISAPDGFIADTTVYHAEVKDRELSALSDAAENVWVNVQNAVKLRVNKRIVTYTTGADGNVAEELSAVPVKELAKFNKSFKIEMFDTAQSQWVTARSLNNNQLLENLGLAGDDGDSYFIKYVKAQNEDGTAIQYRIVETLPEGYSGAGDATAVPEQERVFVQEIPDGIIKPIPDEMPVVTVKNAHKGTLEIQKQTWVMNEQGAGGYDTTGVYKFNLYQKNADGSFTLVPRDISITAGTPVTLEGLDVVSTTDGNKLAEYYLEEIPEEGKIWNIQLPADGTEKVETVMVEGVAKQLIGPYMLNTVGTVTAKIYNVDSLVPYWILKQDAVTKGGAAGAVFTVQKLDEAGNPVGDPGAAVTSDAEGYAFVKLEPNTKYRITEITAPANYQDYTHTDADGHTYQDIVTPGMLTYDSNVDKTTAGYSVPFINQPFSRVRIEKNLVNSIGTVNQYNGAAFAVYLKSDGQFIPYQLNGQDVVLKGNEDGYLEPGNAYYFKEIIDGANPVIDPGKIPEKYQGIKTESDSSGFYFGPYETSKSDGLDQVKTLFALNNYQFGSILVTKKSALTNEKLQGASITLEAEGIAAVTQLTNKDGFVKFENLPVFNESGAPIEYTVRETAPPTGYHGTDNTFKTFLIPGTMIDHRVTGSDTRVMSTAQEDQLLFSNEPYFSLSVHKVWQDDWQHVFYPVDHVLGGVRLAIYEQSEAGLKLLGEQTTRGYDGTVTFKDLDRTKTYYIVEVAPVGDKRLPKDKIALLTAADGALPTELSVEAVEQYNYVKYPVNGEISQSTYLDLKNNPLINHKTWTQLMINKVCVGQDSDGTPHDVEKINGAKFTLYRQKELPGENKVLTAPVLGQDGKIEDLTGYEVVDDYETGTKLDPDTHEKIDGQFDSAILESGYVYWLVEYQAAPKYELGGFAITPFVPGDGFTVDGAASNQPVPYTENGVTEAVITNSHKTGSGGTGEGDYIAQLKLNKWLQETGKTTALGGVTYELWLSNADNKKIELVDRITTGLNSREGLLTGEALSKSIDLRALREKYPEEVSLFTPEASSGQEFYMSAKFVLQEISAPSKIVIDPTLHPVEIVAYENKEYQAANINTDYYYEEKEGNTAVQLINNGISNYPVTITKYGYRPGSNTWGVTDNGLEAVLTEENQVKRLNDVTFTLEQKSPADTWISYSAGELKTNGDGVIKIEDGLPAGEYRLKEELPDTWAKSYAAVYDGKNGAYRYFTVGVSGKNVSVYNPEHPKLEITKTDFNNNAVKGIKFKVGNLTTAATDGNGKTTITIPSGTYTISEEKNVDSGTTNAYFISSSVVLGYNRVINENGELSLQVPADALEDLMFIKRVYQNPKWVNLYVKKVDADDTSKVLTGAEFKVKYIPFANTTETLQMPSAEDNRWKNLAGGRETYTIDNSGELKFTRKDPGWYKFEEVKAPNGYELDEPRVQIIALKSDLPVVIPEGSGVVWSDLNGETKNIMTFANKPFIPLTVTKQLNAAAGITLTDAEKNEAYQNIGFQVYKTTAAGGYQPVPLYQLKNGTYNTAEKLTVTNTAVGEYLGYVPRPKEGEAYFIKEIVTGDTANKWLSGVSQIDGVNVSQMNQDGYIALSDIDGSKALKATVTNLRGLAAVTIKKLGIDKETSAVKDLSGAEFAVYDSIDATAAISGASFKDDGNGEYTFIIPAALEDKQFYIGETKAPATYVLTESRIPVTLKAGDNKKYDVAKAGLVNAENRNTEEYLQALILTNDQGVDIKVTKYGNIYAKAENAETVAGVPFTLYYKAGAEANWTAWNGTSKLTDAKGEITFGNIPVEAGWEYALSEDSYNVEEFWGLESIYAADTVMTPAAIQVDGAEKQVYLLNNLKNTGIVSEYQAYNKPMVEITIQKKDAEGGDAPTAQFKITSLDENGQPAADTKTVETAKANGSNTGTEVKVKLKPGSYRIEEIRANDGFQINRDHKDVIYTMDVSIPDDGTKAIADPYVFSDVKTNVALGLEKASEQTEIPSLLTGAQDITFTLTPKPANNLPLTSFVVQDKGLELFKGTTESMPADDKYTIKEISITGPDGQMPTYENVIKNNKLETRNVKAVIGLYGFSKNIETDEPDKTITVTDFSGEKIKIPTDQKYKGFTVTYLDEDLKAAGDESLSAAYLLGSDFNPGTITVTMTLDKQEESAQTIVPARVKNSAVVKMGYQKWENNGQVKPDTLTANDYAELNINTIPAPRVKIEKSVNSTAAVLPGQTVLTYTVKVTNVSKDGSSLPMINPVIVDTMPKGVEWVAKDGKDVLSLSNGLTVNSIDHNKVDGQEVISVALNGNLEAQKSVEITLQGKVTNGVVSTGTEILNRAFVTTAEAGVKYKDNPKAAAFMTENGGWASDLNDKVLNTAIQSLNLPDNGYISADVKNNRSSEQNVTLLKEVYGDKNPGNYISGSSIAKVSNGGAGGGMATYRLTVNNSSDLQSITNLWIADLLPNPDNDDRNLEKGQGNPRYSKWRVLFNSIEDIYVENSATGDRNEDVDYTLYTEVKKGEEARIAARQALESRNPAGGTWNEGSSFNQKEVTAILLKINNLIMKPGDNLIIVFKADVPEFAEEDLLKNSYTLAVNDFSVAYDNIVDANYQTQATPLTSPPVQIILEPKNVEVGGRIWIDDNNDGIQNDPDHSNDPYIINLFSKGKAPTVKLRTFNGSGDTQGTTTWYQSKDNWDGSFVFGELSPAVPNDGKQLYKWDSSKKTNELIVNALKSPKEAQYYKIEVDRIPEELKLSPKTFWDGSMNDAGKSRMPGDLYGGECQEEARDSNFMPKNQGGYESERFFLWSTVDQFDYTKDIGLVPYRAVELKKQNVSNEGIKDTEFTVYGPFADSSDAKATAAKLAGQDGSEMPQPLYHGVTDANGILLVDGKPMPKLLRYQSYLFVETKASTGYTIYGAEAKNPGIEKIDTNEIAAWVLPSMSELNNPADTQINNIAIINQYKVGTLELEKIDSESGMLGAVPTRLAGAVFELKNLSTEDEGAWARFIAKPITGSGVDEVTRIDDKITFRMEDTKELKAVLSNIPYGEYTLTEVKAPDGYILGGEAWSQTFTINAENEKQSFTRDIAGLLPGNAIPNDPKQLTVLKTERGYDNITLSGAVFILQKTNGQYAMLDSDNSFIGWTDDKEKAGRFETGENGTVVLKRLPATAENETYLLIEEKSPENYAINNNISRFAVNGINHETIHVEDDKTTARAVINKVNADNTYQTLGGAVFGIYTDKGCSDASKVGEITTAANGKAITEDLPFGTYYFKELKSPSGYYLGSDIYTVTLSGISHEFVVMGKDGNMFITNNPQRSDGGSSSGGGGGNPRSPGGSTTTTIMPDEVPLANIPNNLSPEQLLVLMDQDVPLAGLPKTGRNQAEKNLIAMFASALAAIYLGLSLTKKKSNEDDK